MDFFGIDSHSSPLGALIFDGSKNGDVTAVYRLDKFVDSTDPFFPPQGWLGPHQRPEWDYPDWPRYEDVPEGQERASAQYKRVVELLQKYGSAGMPHPTVDFDKTEWRPQRKYTKFYFAAPSEEALYKWFPKKLVAELGKYGFQVRAIPAKRVWLAKSGLQVIFEPARSMQER